MGVPHTDNLFVMPMKAKALIFVSSVILVFCLILLVTGSPILGTPLVNKTAFPSGTIISWIGIIALTITIYLVFILLRHSTRSNYKMLSYVLRSIVIFAALWGLTGFLLAGNWAFIFQNHDEFRGSIEASRLFWIYTASLVLLPVLLILVFWLMILSKKLLEKSKQIPDNQDN